MILEDSFGGSMTNLQGLFFDMDCIPTLILLLVRHCTLVQFASLINPSSIS